MAIDTFLLSPQNRMMILQMSAQVLGPTQQ